MGLVANNSCIPSWFKDISSIPNLPSLLTSQCSSNISITLSLFSLIGKFVDKIDEITHIQLRNKYYWIAGLDSSNSLIFGRAFYTFDDFSGIRVIYFSHWIPTSHDRMLLTPCPGCSLHCLNDNEGPLALKSVGGKLIHRSCLSILPSYRCLNLYQMTSHIDLSQQFINLKLSPFILCSYFRFLLGFSEIYIPEQFLVTDTPSFGQSDDSPAHIPLDPIRNPSPAFALTFGTQFHIVGSVHEGDLSTSHLNCAWLYLSYQNWMNASSVKRVRLKNNFLWSCIFELIRSKHISCEFNGTIKDAPIPPFLARAQDLIKETSYTTPSRLIPLMDEIFPSFLKTMGLFTGFDELLTQDPVTYWRSITDIKNFFSLVGLSRFEMLQTSFHAVDWALSFDNFQQSSAALGIQGLYLLSISFEIVRFPGLYADDSLCPNCGIFMETLEHLFICSPSSLDTSDSNPEPLQHKDITVELIQRFIVKVATKVSYSPECKRTYEELLTAFEVLIQLVFHPCFLILMTRLSLRPGFSEASYHVIFRPSLCDIPD
ncbi:hypothetical protein RhiirA4_430181 [Rhizophagus irregularis]|uniref:Uncharacterized protein n=1 Tax=Rhizophagus irregularis TaxID=588596 RepID=A0A2I1HJR5_9GLOM|nr:hypothetical protein RhiirA4_430181 [Rhizophagus irregularis]